MRASHIEIKRGAADLKSRRPNDVSQARKVAVPGLLLEDELDLIANRATTSIGGRCIRVKEATSCGHSGIGADGTACGRERADTSLCELRMVERVVELRAELDPRGFREPRR